MRTWPDTPYPFGATWDGSGVHFALFSESPEVPIGASNDQHEPPPEGTAARHVR